MEAKDFKKFIILIMAISLLFASIAKIYTVYTHKEESFKMVYMLQEGESCESVAERFGVKVEDLKLEGRYVYFEVK